MPIKDIDEFASTGTKTEPSVTQKARGWVGGEQVAGDQHNWWQNQVTTKLNESIEQGVDTVYPDGDDAHSVVATKLWASTVTPWGICDDAANTISVGGSVAICALESYYNTDGEPRVMALERATDSNEIFIYDPRAASADLSTPIDSSGTLGGLASGGGKTYDALDFCTDGTYVYVLFWEGGSTNGTYAQKYDIATWTAQWGAGVAGIDCDATVGAYPINSQIIVADSLRLAYAIDGTAVSTWNLFNTLLISNGDQADGDGDFTATAGDLPTGAIASDGTNLYAGVYDSSGTRDVIVSAQIASLGSGGSGVAGFPTTGIASVSGIKTLICPAADALVSFWDGDATKGLMLQSGLITDPESDRIYKDAYTTDMDEIVARFNAHTHGGGIAAPSNAAAVSTRFSPDRIYGACFDGLNFWILGEAPPADDFRILCKVPAAKLVFSSTGAISETNFSEVAEGFILNPKAAGGIAPADQGNIVFDGRDVWAAPEPDASTTLSGEIFRLPRANTR